jgi:HEAT repeat protein
MRHVFVAYAREDADFAALLAEDLSRDEFRTWRNHASHAAGEPHEEVDIAIREALAVVAILSPVSARSALVNYEWAFALGSGVPVLPVLLEIAEADLHPRLRTLQYLDFSNRSDRPWHLLMQSLHKLESAQRPTTVHVPRDAPPVIQQAARALDGTNEAERAAALASLGQMNHPAVVEVLAEAVRHPVQQVRFGAAVHLAAHRDARAVPALLDGIRVGFPEVEPWMLGNIGPSAVPALLGALGDENKDVQDAVASQLGRIGGPEAIAALIKSLRDPDANQRLHAAGGLSYAANAAAIPALLEAVHDADREVRRSAIGALVKCAAKTPTYDEVLPALIEALEDEYDQVAIHATEGLAAIPDPRAIAALVRAAVTNQQDQVRAFSRNALKAIGAVAAPELRAAASSPDPRTLYRAINLLKEIHDEKDFPLFIEATRHEDPDVRNIAVGALWDNGVKQGVPALIERLNDDDDHIREVTAGALALIRDPRAIPALVQCLDDEEEEVVDRAAHALSEIGTREARTALRVWKRRTKK